MALGFVLAGMWLGSGRQLDAAWVGGLVAAVAAAAALVGEARRAPVPEGGVPEGAPDDVDGHGGDAQGLTEDERELVAAWELDTGLLAGELPIHAYTDPGFETWLKHSNFAQSQQ